MMTIFAYLIILSTIIGVHCQGFDEEAKNAIVDAHNEVRRAVSPSAANMMEVKWSDCLANVGSNYLETCPGIITHNPNARAQAQAMNCEGSEQFVGENLYWTSRSTVPDVTVATTAWANEKSDYNYVTGCSLGEVCGHYTQMIWYNSYLVGCAQINQSPCGESGTTIICNYAIGGNIVGSPPYTEGQACSQCATSSPNCNEDLCSINAPTMPNNNTAATEPNAGETTNTPTSNASSIQAFISLVFASIFTITFSLYN